MLIAFMAVSFSTTAQNIVIDGNIADWDNVPYTHQNAEGTGGNLLALKSVGSATHFNFLLEGSATMEFDLFQILLDTDNNSGTGYNNDWQYGAGAGADYKIEGSMQWLWGGLASHAGDPALAWAGFTEIVNPINSIISRVLPVVEVGGKKYLEFSVSKQNLGTLGSTVKLAIIQQEEVTYNVLGALPAIDNAQAATYLQINTTGSTTLPISLASFTASSIANTVKLNWSTHSEKNNSHFEIFKSVDGLAFEKISTVTGNNNSSEQKFYSYTDFNPAAGISYYELKQVDLDGKVTSLGIKDVNQNLQTSEFSLAKVSDNVVQISVYSEKPIQTQFQVADINGRIINKTPVSLVAGHQKINIPISLTPGIGVASIKTSSKLLNQKILTN